MMITTKLRSICRCRRCGATFRYMEADPVTLRVPTICPGCVLARAGREIWQLSQPDHGVGAYDDDA